MEPLTPDEVDSPTNVLFVDSMVRERTPCGELRHETGESARLVVTFADGRETAGPETVDEADRLLAIGRAPDEFDVGEGVGVETVADPIDLSAIGISILQFCVDRFEAGTSPEVCFDSLDALLERVSPNKTVQFALALTERLSNSNAYAHFHLDSSRHEDDFVSNLEEAFDDVVRRDRAESDTETRGEEATDEEIAVRFAMRGGTSADERGPSSFSEPPAEATDEAVATAFDEDPEEADPNGATESELPSEATDEEVARRLETELD